jgi:diguanylate cyclase (GGDEF)-like protein
MGANLAEPESNSSSQSALTPRVLQLLAVQEQSPTVAVITRHVRDVLEIHQQEAVQNHALCLALLRDLLGIYSSQLPAGSPRQVEANILQLRLAQQPDRAELESLRKHILMLARETGVPAAPPATPAPPAPVETPAAIVPVPPRMQAPEALQPPAPPTPAVSEPAPGEAGEDHRLDVTQRRQLEEKRAHIQKIQETLARQVRDVIKQNERFGALLTSEHENLLQSEDVESLQKLKQSLIGEVVMLQEGHSALTKKLEIANNYLQIIESEGQYLNDELTRVHILSLTDELTELPNRRAFLRRLEDEVARVQRYGYPLSLALIDMDGFKAVNDKYGHAAGDEVLRNFSTNILSIFRHHDMVARYGGEEFAVLLPNTDKAGALRALEKVKKRNTESSYQLEGRAMPMPTFSAGISLYKPGETPGNLIERADKALYQAKRLGRNRIELAQHDGADPASR